MYRESAGLTQEELAVRAGLARETVIRIEGGRPARAATIARLAAALRVMPSTLAGVPEVDPPEQAARRCTDCGVLRPIQAFLPIRGTRGYHGRCRLCRNARRWRARSHARPRANA